MSGPKAARALEARFEGIAQGELVRLSRKLRALAGPERQEVEAIARTIVQAIVAPPARALRDSDEPRLVEAACRLFGVSNEVVDLPAR